MNTTKRVGIHYVHGRQDRARYKDRLTRAQRRMPLMLTPNLTHEQVAVMQKKHQGEIELLRQLKAVVTRQD